MKDRKAYLDKMEAQLKAWKADLDKLAARTEKASADARVSMSRALTTLEQKYEAVRTQLSEMTNAGEDAFGALKGKFESARMDFEQALRRWSAEHSGETVKAAR